MTTTTPPVATTGLTFDDEFNSFLSSPNGSVGWMTSYPYGGESARALPGNHEAEYYSDSSVGVNPFSDSNGVLSISAAPAAAGSNPYGMAYTSGLITTYHSFAQQYGYFEASVEMPAGQGLWPAFWMLDTGAYNTELDVFEVLENQPSTIYETIHDNTNIPGDATETIVNPVNTTTGFHTYGVDWEPTTTSFYIDGKLVATQPTSPLMNAPMYMLLNLAVGGTGSWPGTPNSSTQFPATMQIDYVHAYATANTVLVSGTQAILSSGVSGQVLLGTNGYAGVTVSLINAIGNVIATTVTDANGKYSFSKLASGNYQVQYTPPYGMSLLSGTGVNQTTGVSTSFSVGDNQTANLSAETLAGPTHPATIQGTVEFYGNTNNLTSGTPQAGATVSLLVNGTVVETTTTNSLGQYTFGQLPAGTYQVSYAAPSGQTIEPGTNSTTQSITLAAGQTVTAPSGATVSLASISGQVDLNGVADAGFNVALLNSAGSVIATGTTDSTGTYKFANLAAGNYQVKFSPASGQALVLGSEANIGTWLGAPVAVAVGQAVSLPTELVVTNPATIQGKALHFGGATDPAWGGGDSGITVSLLNASHQVIGTTVTNGSGWYDFVDVGAGTYQVQYTIPANQEVKPGTALSATGLSGTFTVAAGANVIAPQGSYISVATLNGQVLLQNTGESGVAVSLVNSAGATVGTTTTDSNGNYSFTNLATGSYSLDYATPSGQQLVGSSTVNATTGISTPIALTAGATTAAPTVSFAPLPATISGSVTFAGATQSGITVSLLNSSGTVVGTATSDSTGAFSFTGLSAGSYQLSYTAPSGEVLQSGPASSSTGLTQAVAVTAGQTLTMATENLAVAPATLAGSVVYAGSGQSGVTISLLDSTGTVVSTTHSDSTGSFSFSGLTPGSYQVSYTPPANEILSSGPANSTTGVTSTVTLTAGQTTTLAPETLSPATCSVSGTVDVNGVALAGDTISLLSSAGKVLATTTTDSTGTFGFSGLSAGSYEVSYAAPHGDAYETGGATAYGTGTTAAMALAAGSSTTLATENLLTNAANIQGLVLHYGGATDPVYGGGDGGVTVSLLNASGSVIATTTTASNGWYIFRSIGAGTYQVQFTPPAGQMIKTGTSGTATVVVASAAGQMVAAPNGSMVSAITMNGSGLTQTETAGSYVVTGTASNSTLTLGAGNQTVTLTGGGDTVTTGAGNSTITLSGTGNTVTAGSGWNTIVAGSGNDVVHAAGGHEVISATGTGNVFDGGSGISFLNADGSAGNTFFTNAAGSSLMTTISGFNTTAQDTIDLSRTLAGTSILSDLSNVSSYITAAASGANTVLYVDPTGGHGTPQAFATLSGVHTTVAALQSAHDFSLA
jgi:beta-glucanase (GH16 family)